jgi:hypothetical protein
MNLENKKYVSSVKLKIGIIVVILCVVGILLATVLTPIGYSPLPKDVQITARVNLIIAVIETLYSTSTEKYPFAEDIKKIDGIQKVFNEIKRLGSEEIDIIISPDQKSHVVFAKLNSGQYYCVDSAGNRKESKSRITDTICR